MTITTIDKLLDYWPGAPSVVIRDPAAVIGDQADVVLAFWRYLDRMTARDWLAARAAAGEAAWNTAWDAARDAALAAAGNAAWDAARATARATARAAAGDAAWAAARATNEIQGAAIMRAKGQAFYFLPLFGFADPEAIITTKETL